jgi:hypothetical protein
VIATALAPETYRDEIMEPVAEAEAEAEEARFSRDPAARQAARRTTPAGR